MVKVFVPSYDKYKYRGSRYSYLEGLIKKKVKIMKDKQPEQHM